MAHITFVHGMANKPPVDRLETLWLRALERDNPRPDIFPPPNEGINRDTYSISSSMVYWADVLYPAPNVDESGYGYESGADETIFEGVPRDPKAWKGVQQFDPEMLHGEEREAVEKIAYQLGMKAEVPDDYVATPEEFARATAEEYRLERIPLPWFVKKEIMKTLLRDVHHYLFNSEVTVRGTSYKVRDELRSRLLKALQEGAKQPGPHVIVSHSMGTIIAYDVLRNCPECPAVDHLITLGSPLGLDEVQDKLKAPGLHKVDFPAEKLKGEWVNVFDHLDPVAGFDPRFANDYLKGGAEVVTDINEQNWGDWRHSIQKYLSGPKLRAQLRRVLGI